MVDGSLLEAFADDGAAAITTRAYPRAGSWAAVRLEHGEGVRVTAAGAWRLRDDVIAEG